MIHFEIQRWDRVLSKWVMQSGGQGDIEYIMKDWEWWSRRPNEDEYRLIFIITHEVEIASTENG